jgi:hypothetical protein
MSEIKFDVIFIAAVFAPIILFLVVPVTITYFVNRKEITADQKKREIEEINQAIPFADVSEAKKQALSGNVKIILGYGAYFVTVVPVLVLLLGKIHYGPNIPYLIFLCATGIPWLVCFIQSLMRAEKQCLRIRASNTSTNPSSLFSINGIVVMPFILIGIITVALRISNQVLR